MSCHSERSKEPLSVKEVFRDSSYRGSDKKNKIPSRCVVTSSIVEKTKKNRSSKNKKKQNNSIVQVFTRYWYTKIFKEMAENSFLHRTTNDANRSAKASTERNYASTAVKDYVNQRREKAAKQARDEKKNVSNTKLS